MNEPSRQRLRLMIRGAVQGVGFRPFVYRLASELRLAGCVCNTTQGVLVEAEGAPADLDLFLLRVGREKPARAVIQGLEPIFLDAAGYQGFEIQESRGGDVQTWVLPDIAICAACRAEVLDPNNRRYRYPFTNCTHCGPRYSIIENLPYDRPNISMKKFKMCRRCEAEYRDPGDRRFHAQPNACPDCGPRLQLWDVDGKVLAEREEALTRTVTMIRNGRVVAVKGLGGFHLMADATQEQAVQSLRRKKHRPAKPFAVMYPDVETVLNDCELVPFEVRLLESPEAPIVLVRRRPGSGIAPSVAPDNPYLGVMLPYTPLHVLLLQDIGGPVVATSGNLAEETIRIDEQEALKSLCGIADAFLVHDRPIVRAVDDSVVRVIRGTEQVLRRARGYAPQPVLVKHDLPSILAVGGHLKNCVALSKGRQIFISQHIGDLETAQSTEAFTRAVNDLPALYRVKPERVACDLHPDYFSTRLAQGLGLPLVPVQHHYAHALSCMAENEIDPPVLSVSWDGTGYGPDGTVWGGEFLLIKENGFERVAHFLPFPLPGGDTAVREPRRSALGALYSYFGKEFFDRPLKLFSSFSAVELGNIRQMLERDLNSPKTSSVGRLFDAVASLAGTCQENRFEGQAAMGLEFLLPEDAPQARYSFRVSRDGQGCWVIQAPLWEEVLQDIDGGETAAVISSKFHHMLVDVVLWAAKNFGMKHVVLTGGCFQNRYLSEKSIEGLRREGFHPYWHQRVPPNDGGIALGQVLGAARQMERDRV